jgi:ankyrin repeat protein
VVKELLDRGANIKQKDNIGWTPLIWGIFLNNSIILNDSFIFYL